MILVTEFIETLQKLTKMTFCQHLNQNSLGLKGKVSLIFNFAVFLNHMKVDEQRKIKVYKYSTSFSLAVLQHAVSEI